MYIIIVDLTKYDYHRVFTGTDEHHIFVFGASQIVCKYAWQCNTIKEKSLPTLGMRVHQRVYQEMFASGASTITIKFKPVGLDNKAIIL
jgi:hypothetical protein